MEQQMLSNIDGSVRLLEKKRHDLRLSQALAVQLAIQIKMVKENDVELKNLMQESILFSIPIWRMQLSLNGATQDAQFVADMHKSMNQSTNKMLEQNAALV